MATATKKKVATKNPPGRPVGHTLSDSMVTRLCLLAEGECESRSHRIPLAEATADRVSSLKDTLSSTLRKACSRATERSDNEFVVNTGDFRTQDDHVIVSAVATRIV